MLDIFNDSLNGAHRYNHDVIPELHYLIVLCHPALKKKSQLFIEYFKSS